MLGRSVVELPKKGDVLLGKYRIDAQIGHGGMGVVYSVSHLFLQTKAAVKLVRPEYVANPEAVARFQREARASAAIESDHVARVLDVGMLDGSLPYMVMEFLEGNDLAQLLRS